jgi:chemotaxis protein MotB
MAPILQQLPNPIQIAGYTAVGEKFSNPNYGAWDLSTDRANVVRQILGEFGLSDDHISAVEGRGSTNPLFPNDPYMAGNERVEITLLNEPPPVPPDMKP